MKNSELPTNEDAKGTGQERCYRSYNSGGALEFCPMKDLNLPESYEEVLNRFQKLQGERAMEVLN